MERRVFKLLKVKLFCVSLWRVYILVFPTDFLAIQTEMKFEIFNPMILGF